jgi:WD40 repeat protein
MCFQGLPREGSIHWNSNGEIVAINTDGNLAAWNPDRGRVREPSNTVRNPRIVRWKRNTGSLLCVVDNGGQEVRIQSSDFSNDCRRIEFHGPRIVDADVDCEEKHLVLLTLDATVRVLDSASGKSLHDYPTKEWGRRY